MNTKLLRLLGLLVLLCVISARSLQENEMPSHMAAEEDPNHQFWGWGSGWGRGGWGRGWGGWGGRGWGGWGRGWGGGWW